MSYYNRKVELRVSDSSKTLTFTDLHIDFYIEKTAYAMPNKAKFMIYNLSEQSRGFINKEGMSVIFFAGYEKAEQSIFKGEIIRNGVSHEYNGVDWLTVIDCQDGRQTNKAKVSKSFEGKVALTQGIDYLINVLGVGKGYLKIKDKTFNNGLAFSGFAIDRLKELCKNEKLNFSIQDNNVYILPRGEKIEASVFKINKDNGLIGSPVKTDRGVHFEALLNPKLRCEYDVELESRTIKGKYKIMELSFYGTNFNDKFYSGVEAFND